MPRRRQIIHENTETCRKEVLEAIDRYVSTLLPPALAHRVNDAKAVARDADLMRIQAAFNLMSAVCGFIAWHGEDVPLEQSLTRPAIQRWSTSVLSVGSKAPTTHDKITNELYRALDILNDIYRPRLRTGTTGHPGFDDKTLDALIDWAGSDPRRRAYIAAGAGAGLGPTNSSSLVVSREGEAVFAAHDGVTRRVLSEFAALVDGPCEVTLRNAKAYNKHLSRLGLRTIHGGVQANLRRAWRRRTFALPASPVLLLAAYPIGEVTLTASLAATGPVPWKSVAPLLRGKPTTGGEP
jgi:hypothetical protein